MSILGQFNQAAKPDAPLLIGTITGRTTGGGYVITLVGGGTATASSELNYATGKNVFFRDGKITGEASVGEIVELEIY